MTGDVIIIAVMLVLGAAVVALWIKKEEYKDERIRKDEAIGQLMAGAEIWAQRDTERKALIERLRKALDESNEELIIQRLMYQGAKVQIEQFSKEQEASLNKLAALDMKSRNLELALTMEQKNVANLEESLKYYMELCAGQVKSEEGTVKSEGEMSRWALRVCLDNALQKNAKLERVIRRMRDRGRFPQMPQIDAQMSQIEGELDAEFDGLRASGCATSFDVGGDGYDPKVDPGVPSGEEAVECEEYEIGEVKDAQGV
jgi:hypothetical protein